ncbi:putative NAD(P)/FAD-binding protein YdhS [Pedobacter cryoconitis]|uniref:Putative NAD(P)/FAD-binding protein YdhS n=1 Tax=Pedobacter cryoconitis TaxID=188932 RepID=A0A7W9DK55_9SPHI|nr:FAD/NAD(P)-binding protein [Pedobacter cryoconitis]MBB5620860.1 putative NAD(P)/FAD-binding protein YdhS [Pedobacter cryoconitis]MBB5645918.1 putative NAD(P)/FAD-binding protein YdhS [Pedobacter cryoconitis]
MEKRIGILGGGPSGLFMFKRLIESGRTDIVINIFERKNKLGAGMPYSTEGALDEHITNVSSNEIPLLVTSLADWIKSVPKDTLDKFHIDPLRFNEYKVLPRLLFGQYLTSQFDLLRKMASENGIEYQIFYNSTVTDIIDYPDQETVVVEINDKEQFKFDHVIICTGHNWPKKYEGKVPGYFDSPYPPVKLAVKLDHPVAIKGSSLTAVDAIRTLARYNGTFDKDNNGNLFYQLLDHSPNFKLVLHTRNGMLPAVRFHLEDSHLANDSLLTAEEIAEHIASNNGFLSLDYIFEKDFKLPIKEKEPEFYEKIKDMSLEEFVTAMMDLRERLNPFQLLKAEYAEAEKSILRKKSVYWKEMLGVLSFALNYPAKYLSAEDMMRLHKSLTPLISIVIAYIPQSSSEEILAMYEAGVLELIPVGDDSEIEAMDEGGATYHYTDEAGEEHSVYFNTYIDCVGQPHLAFEDFPFKSLLSGKTVSPAKLRFRSSQEGQKALADGKEVMQDQNDDYYLKVSGITINDNFQIVDAYGALNERIYIMAVPYIGGYNPDYSGLDFSEAASAAIIKQLIA